MQGISLADLHLSGGFGISRILDFSMREYPGEHAAAEITGTAETSGIYGPADDSPVEVYAGGGERALFQGVIRRAESREENGCRVVRLELASGSILMDRRKEKRSFQDVSMTYGEAVRQAAAEAGMTALCPEEMEGTATGIPLIQYRETVWEFAGRLASRFGLPVYPEPSMGGGKLCIGLPETGYAGPMSYLGYTARADGKFYRAGGEASGRDRRHYLTYEVTSLDLFRVGDTAEWKGKRLRVCAREVRTRGGHLESTYILADKEWAWQRRTGNPKISGMSLLGTVEGCAGETVRLKLDIDRDRPEQPCYPWAWAPATGNLMYMMPQAGTRVSLYFKGDEEESGVAVNCIRSGSCAGEDYRDRSLTTEDGMELRLCRGEMGVATLKEKVLLDDLKGIGLEGSGGLHILAAGGIKLEAKEVSIGSAEGVTLYEGKAELNPEGLPGAEGESDAGTAAAPENLTIHAMGKVELTEEEGEMTVQNRGEKTTCYLAWEHEDLSDPSFRYRDEPEQKDYDWMQLGVNVAGALVLAGSMAVLASTAVGLAAEAGLIQAGAAGASGAAAAVGKAAFLTGALYVGEQAVSDIIGGRVSDTEKYVRKALAGSAVGFLSGATGLLMQGAGLGKTLALGYSEGFLGSIITQGLLNDDGEINWAVAIGEGAFSAVMAGVTWESCNIKENVFESESAAGIPLKDMPDGELNYSNIMHELREGDSVEGDAVAKLLKKDKIEVIIAEKFSDGRGGAYFPKSGKIYIYEKVKLPSGEWVLQSPNSAAGFLTHETKHWIDGGVKSKLDEFNAYMWQKKVDRNLKYTADDIWNTLNTHSAYRYLKD